MESICEIVRRAEDDYVTSKARISKYVEHSLYDTLERIDAYLNSTFIGSDTDSLGRDKPFFNIVVAAANVWFRATDIDRSNIKIRATKAEDWILSVAATAKVQEWMREVNFGKFLNEWGRVLARYGSAVVKVVENSTGLHIEVVPWNRLIVDQIDMSAAPVIEVIELSESQLRKRVSTHGYDKDIVEELIETHNSRELKDRSKKDNVSHFIKVYEIHGEMEKSLLTDNEKDDDIFVQQMHVVSFVNVGKGRTKEYKDYTLIKGTEKKDPYSITHLIKEDGRTLARGAVEQLFDAQWMQNHSIKAVKDQLDLAGKIIFQTSDARYIGRNVVSDVETGDIFIHDMNQPLTQLNNQPHGVVEWQNYSSQWKQLGNEINGISEAMLGATPKSGTAWRQTEALLTESHSLFEIMTENKGLALEDLFRNDVLPYIKKRLLDNTDEIVAVLDGQQIKMIDERFIKAKANEAHNNAVIDDVINGVLPTSTPELQQRGIEDSLAQMGNTRFLKPSDISDKTWKEVFKDFEMELEIDITGEQKNTAEAMTTLNTALQVAANPQFLENKLAQSIVGKILELTGTMSALELTSLMQQSKPPMTGSMQLPELTQTQNATRQPTQALV